MMRLDTSDGGSFQYIVLKVLSIASGTRSLPFIDCIFSLHVLGSPSKPQKMLRFIKFISRYSFMNISAMLFKLYHAIESLGDLVNMQILI